MKILEHLPEWYVPLAQLMLLVGAHEEHILALQRCDITPDSIRIGNVLHDGVLHRAYKIREVPLTARIRQVLEPVLSRGSGRFIFTTPSGSPLTALHLRHHWTEAVRRGRVPHHSPHALRATCAAWLLAAGMRGEDLCRLMAYNDCRRSLAHCERHLHRFYGQRESIRTFFGEDFFEKVGGTVQERPTSCGGEQFL